jgi:hypothetical protein
MLDPYSLVKSNKTKLFHLGFENSKGNIKEKIKLSIFQLDYIINIFIHFLESLNFLRERAEGVSKKKINFYCFKLITTLIYQGKHLIEEIKINILELSYTMNNYRLSTNTNTNKKNNLIKKNINEKNFFPTIFEKYLSLDPLFGLNDIGQIINYKTGKIIRDIYVVIKKDNGIRIYPTILNSTIELSISRNTVTLLISNGKSLLNKI